MRNFLRTLKRTLDLLGRERRWRWLILVGLALAVAAFEVFGALLVAALLQVAVTAEDEMRAPVVGDLAAVFPDTDHHTLLLATAIATAAFFLIRGSVLVGQAYIQQRMVHNAAARLSTHLVRGYLAMPYLVHTTRNSAELVRNTFDSPNTLATQVMVPLVKVVSQAILVVGLVAILLWTSPLATLLVLGVFGPLIWLLMRVLHPRLRALGRRAQAAKEGSLQGVQQALGGVRDIKLLGKEEHFARVFGRQRRALARATYVHGAMVEAPRALIETTLVLVIVMLFAIVVVAGDSVEGVLSALGVFGYVGLRLQPSLRDVVKGLNDIKYGSAVLDDLTADRERVDIALASERHQRGTAPPVVDFVDRIELREVTFAYSPSATALAGVNLAVRKGEFVGVCGPTGGGKSTLVDLIAGLLLPSDGSVRVDGHNLRDVTTWWQQQLGVVSQSVFLIDDTIRHNIALGIPESEIDMDRLGRAVDRAQLNSVIAQLPDGLDTVVGERGIRLSGGQRQRVAVARAFYREPAVLILDEGTSALDTATEAAMVAAIDELKAGRTLIAVAHRISTVRRADRIVVVDAGRVAAEGTYDDLLRQSDLFRTLAR